MRQNEVKKITLGAMMLALIGVLLLFNTLSAGLVLGIISFVVPIPYIFYTREYGLKAGLILLFSNLVMGLVIAPIEQVVLCILYGIIGIIYGYGVFKGLNDKIIFFFTLIGTIIVYIITMILFGAIFGYDIASEIKFLVDMVNDMYGGQTGLQTSVLNNLASFTFFLFIVFQAVLEAFVIHMLATLLFMYLKKPLPKKVKFIDVQYPSYLAIGSALLFLLMIYAQNYNVYPEYQYLFKFLGSLGFAYLSYLGLLFFYKSKRFSKWKLYSIIIFILTLASYAPLHLAIGLFTSLSGFWRTPNE